MWSEKYRQVIQELTEWFAERLDGKTVTMTSLDVSRGCDALPEPFDAMPKDAFEEWKFNRSYEVSYSQMCTAFFRAAKRVGALEITA